MPIQAHQRVFAAFFVYAFALGGLFPRLGDVQRQLGLAEGELGLGLIGLASGTLVSLAFAARVAERLGARTALRWLLPLLALAMALSTWAGSPLTLYLLLLPAGLLVGAVEVVVNLEADRVEHQTGQRIMNRAHAFWSLGFFSAGAVGAAFSQLGWSPRAQLLSMVPVVGLATVWLLRNFVAAEPRGQSAQANATPTPHFARPTTAIFALMLLTLPALMMEGAASDWSAIYMRDVFASPPFVSGAAVAIGALAQGMARFVADAHVQRHGPVRVAQVLTGVLGAGLALVAWAPHPALALVGFALMGVGTSAMFPLAMSAAAQRTDRAAAVNVAALAQTAFVAFLLGPPLLGQLAQHLGIRWVFGLALPLLLLAWPRCAALRVQAS